MLTVPRVHNHHLNNLLAPISFVTECHRAYTMEGGGQLGYSLHLFATLMCAYVNTSLKRVNVFLLWDRLLYVLLRRPPRSWFINKND